MKYDQREDLYKVQREEAKSEPALPNHRQALQKAWYEQTKGYVHPTNPAYESGFIEGFNAAWDALMAEIGPLVADLRTERDLAVVETHTAKLNARMEHTKSIRLLRELINGDKNGR